jgi:hypothetical protein
LGQIGQPGVIRDFAYGLNSLKPELTEDNEIQTSSRDYNTRDASFIFNEDTTVPV